VRQMQKAEVDGIVSGRWRFSRRGFLVAKGRSRSRCDSLRFGNQRMVPRKIISEGGIDKYKKIRPSRSVSRQLMPNGLFHPRE
jgi:hypothetical protein